MIIEIIHCDKCDSTDVLHEQVPVHPTEAHYKMSEYAKKMSSPQMTYDVYTYTHYRMICKSCGHIVRYQR